MNFLHTSSIRFAMLILALLLVACDSSQNPESGHAPRTPGAADRCPVCGMAILGWPGPKGQLFLTDAADPLFFDNTIDLMEYVLHPDHQARVGKVYVQDMSLADWDQPDVAPWIDARQAWFVAGHNRMGSMGPTLASFGDKQAALAFRDQYQGEVLAYQDIDRTLLRSVTGTATGDAGHDPRLHHGHDH